MSRIILAAGASAALHKSCDLASKLYQAGHEVRAVLTPNAARLVNPQLFEALTGQPAQSSEFGEGRRGGMDHIELSQWAELYLAAPVPADLLSRLALGLANDLPTTVALALDPAVPRLLAPAMNPHMLASPPIARNLETLLVDGWQLVSPGSGHMACGVEGRGRLAEPAEIVERVAEVLA